MQPSRRAFLFGRQTPRTPWDAFLQRLGRLVQGRVSNLGAERAGQPLGHNPGTEVPNRARLTAVHREDVRQARALCAEYGVVLQLAGLADDTRSAVPQAGARDPWDAAAVDGPGQKYTNALAQGDVLEVDPSSLDMVTHDPESGQWVAQPGCRVGELAASGLLQFRGAPPEWTLAAWLARSRGWMPGATAMSGVVQAELLFSDGTVESLGAFGASDVRPLRSAMVQRLVPALFQLSSSPDAVICREAPQWPCRYRLDALQPTAPAQVNLAQLLLGHGGTLAWVESVTLIPSHPGGAWPVEPAMADPGALPVASPCPAGTPSGVGAMQGQALSDEKVANAARRLQIRMKNAFDPLDLYGD
ncbi:hypothetical protein [Bordetella muralis]|uniref:hypothetical protein n=1 Tax=Bordetella muralis TaxID=1649130 RepID=UPI0039EF5C3D